MVVAFALLVLLVRLCVRHIFMGDAAGIRWPDANPELPDPGAAPIAGRRLIVLRSTLSDTHRKELRVVVVESVRNDSVAAILSLVCRPSHDGILLSHFEEGLSDGEVIAKKLDLLESLNEARWLEKHVCIESAVDPLERVTAHLRDRGEDAADAEVTLARWSAALENYQVLPQRSPVEVLSDLDGTTPERFDPAVALKVEAAPVQGLAEVSAWMKAQDRFTKMKEDDVAEAVLEMARPHYRSLWAACSTDERLLLHRVAREGLISRRAKDVLRPLLWRGLVVMRPSAALMNESFRRFVLSAERSEVFAMWESRGGASVWARMRGPALLALGVLALFFFATQREALSRALGLVAAITAVPGVVSILSSASRLRDSSNSKTEAKATQ